MDSTNLPTSNSSAQSSGGSSATAAAAAANYFNGPSSALDANALQAAYLVLQMQSQLQQNQQQPATPSTTFPHFLTALSPDIALEAERILAQAALAQIHISTSAPSQFQDPSSSSSTTTTTTPQLPLSPSRQTSAFSPPRPIGNSITATAPSQPPQYSSTATTAPLDVMLLQMQMAAAAAGLVQTPFNLLPSTSMLGLLAAPNFRLQSSNSATLGSLPFAPNTSTSSLPQLVPTTTNVPSQQHSLIEQTPAPSTYEDSASRARPSSSLPGSPVKTNETSTSPLPRCYTMGKQQKDSLKRLHSDMTVLRSLCDDTEIVDEIPLVKKRSRNDENERDRRMQAAEVMASIGLRGTGTPPNRRRLDNRSSSNSRDHNDKERSNSCGGSSSCSKTVSDSASSSQIPSGDPNSPNRHHPLNHRPPAMEARFLECMAAIALHSDFPLPMTVSSSVEKEDDSSASQSSETDKCAINDENGTENRSETKSATPSNNSVTNSDDDDEITVVDEKLDEKDEKEKDCSMSSEDDKPSQNDKDEEMAERLMHKSEKRTWPTTAIDDELCKELENYKGTDVPMIHAYVIPPRSDTSSSSGDTPDERAESPPFHSVPSLAVPVPILNILLERILHTMLQT